VVGTNFGTKSATMSISTLRGVIVESTTYRASGIGTKSSTIPAASTNQPRPTEIRWPFCLREGAGWWGFVRGHADFGDGVLPRFGPGFALSAPVFSPGFRPLRDEVARRQKLLLQNPGVTRGRIKRLDAIIAHPKKQRRRWRFPSQRCAWV
jgi:hypothetical protein